MGYMADFGSAVHSCNMFLHYFNVIKCGNTSLLLINGDVMILLLAMLKQQIAC